ncbi:hypothetical protein BC830DRAFT_1233010 [Chytriomyces sp. MP71]|nr:hypothetical protein BC830DRAFT_1233010 [Chytriomyces sp. MP71]
MLVLLSPTPPQTQLAVPPLPRVFKRPRGVANFASTSASASTPPASILQPHSHSLALSLAEGRARADQDLASAVKPLRCGTRQRMNAMSGGRPSLTSLQMSCDSDSDGEADHTLIATNCRSGGGFSDPITSGGTSHIPKESYQFARPGLAAESFISTQCLKVAS